MESIFDHIAPVGPTKSPRKKAILASSGGSLSERVARESSKTVLPGEGVVVGEASGRDSAERMPQPEESPERQATRWLRANGGMSNVQAYAARAYAMKGEFLREYVDDTDNLFGRELTDLYVGPNDSQNVSNVREERFERVVQHSGISRDVLTRMVEDSYVTETAISKLVKEQFALLHEAKRINPYTPFMTEGVMEARAIKLATVQQKADAAE